VRGPLRAVSRETRDLWEDKEGDDSHSERTGACAGGKLNWELWAVSGLPARELELLEKKRKIEAREVMSEKRSVSKTD